METIREILEKKLTVETDRAKEIRTILERTIVALKGVIVLKDETIKIQSESIAYLREQLAIAKGH